MPLGMRQRFAAGSEGPRKRPAGAQHDPQQQPQPKKRLMGVSPPQPPMLSAPVSFCLCDCECAYGELSVVTCAAGSLRSWA